MPHKRIAVIGQPGAINGCFEKTSEQLFKECGLNTGNLAFWYAMNRHIEGNKSFLGWGVKPEFLKNNFDAVVFPAANQLNPDWDMSILADLFEKADLYKRPKPNHIASLWPKDSGFNASFREECETQPDLLIRKHRV